MSKILIDNELESLLEMIKVEAGLAFPREDKMTVILASTVFLSVFIPDESLRPNALFDKIVKGTGSNLNLQWVRSWALGRQGVFSEDATKALPIIREHVVALQAAAIKHMRGLLDTLEKEFQPDPNALHDGCDD